MEFGVQIVSLAVVLTICISYFRNRRMPVLSAKLFTGFVILAVCNIGLEFSTLYTIYHIETVNPWFNRICHQFFIGSLLFLMFFLFLYVDMKARQQKRYTVKQWGVRIVPVAAAVITVIAGRLEYHIGEDGRYSYGMMASTVYVLLSVYVLLTMTILIRKGIRFDRTERTTILLGILVWAVIAVIQLLNPTKLLSSMGVALMTLFVYISMENPKEYTDYQIPQMLNRHAFEVVQTEWFESKKDFFIIVFGITNATLLTNTYGPEVMIGIKEKMVDFLRESEKHPYRGEIYHLNRRSIGVLTGAEIVSQELFTELEKICRAENENAELQIQVLSCPEYADSPEKAHEIIHFLENGDALFQQSGILHIGKEIIERFEYTRTVEKIVQKAIREDGLEVYYQPIYNTREKRFASAEALVRLKDKETVGFISPEFFIPIAEKRNMIRELGQIVFEEVCSFYSRNSLKELGIDYIEVNLSGKQIVDVDLPQMLLYFMKRCNLPTECINLEITETAAVEAKDLLEKNVSMLHEAGFTFSMDDFGTGYSNLSEMADTEFELIKLDKSLIWPCFEQNPKKPQVILEACIDMVQNIGKHIVAEGVETKEQADYLTERGVLYLQGYYYSRPLPGPEFIEFLRKNNASAQK